MLGVGYKILKMTKINPKYTCLLGRKSNGKQTKMLKKVSKILGLSRCSSIRIVVNWDDKESYNEDMEEMQGKTIKKGR